MKKLIAALGVAVVAPLASANEVDVASGFTSVALDTETLAAAAGLELSRVSEEVRPGAINDSVAFPINARDAASLPTTFSYDTTDFFGTFAGTIEHTGSVFFNSDAVEVGNFTIGFDPARAGTLNGNASGFFVASTTGIAATLFDVSNPSILVPGAEKLTIKAELLVSPEFAQFLLDNGLATSDLSGADVGTAFVRGATDCTGADVNDDGAVDGADLRLFLWYKRLGDPRADFDGFGHVSGYDVLIYLRRFRQCRIGH